MAAIARMEGGGEGLELMGNLSKVGEDTRAGIGNWGEVEDRGSRESSIGALELVEDAVWLFSG